MKNVSKLCVRDIVSTTEIANLLNMRHDDVLKHVRSALTEAGIDAEVYLSQYMTSQDRPALRYMLPQFEFDLIISGLSVQHRIALLQYGRKMEDVAKQLYVENYVKEFKSDMKALTKQAKDANKAKAIADQRKDVMMRSRDVARRKAEVYKTKAKNTRVLNKNQGESIVTKDKTIKESKKTITHLQEDASKLAYKLRNPEFEENVMHKGNKYVKECYSGRRKPTNEMNELMGQFDNVVYDMEEIVRKLGEELARNK